MKKLLVVGLTPTVQRTLRFGSLALGSVNRARATHVTASGKGVNVARVATLLGESAQLVQILGGPSGKFLSDTLDQEGVAHATVWADDDAPTRTCSTLLADDTVPTELVEEAAPVSPHDLALLLAATKNALLDSAAICLSGSLPPGTPPDFYARIVEEATALGVPALVDTQKEPLRRALAARPYLVKPNRDEALTTLGIPPTGDPFHDARTAALALIDAGAQHALITLGHSGALFYDGTGFTRILPPHLTPVNPIGSGDSLTAGFAVAHFLHRHDLLAAVAFGTACAAANCLTLTSGVLDPADVPRLLPEVTCLPA